MLAAVVDAKGLRLMNNHREEQETFRYIKQNTNLADINRMLDRAKGIIAPVITGRAHITAEAKLILDEEDPFCWGIKQEQ